MKGHGELAPKTDLERANIGTYDESPIYLFFIYISCPIAGGSKSISLSDHWIVRH